MKLDKAKREELRALEAKATRGEWTHDADDSASIRTDCATVEHRDEEAARRTDLPAIGEALYQLDAFRKSKEQR